MSDFCLVQEKQVHYEGIPDYNSKLIILKLYALGDPRGQNLKAFQKLVEEKKERKVERKEKKKPIWIG